MVTHLEPDKNENATPGAQAEGDKGPQGVDKAPGEEPSTDNVQFVQETQKGKKVDADLTNEEERPIEQDKNL